MEDGENQQYVLNSVEQAGQILIDCDNVRSALEWAWMRILGRSFKPGVQKQFEAVFTDRECLEELGFSILHKMVLGIVSGSLARQLNTNALEVNVCDNSGRTCLSWAAQRGDARAVNLLLEHNADPNVATPTGMAPLHFAVEALTPTCIAPLLAHGADPFAVDQAMHTALHLAVSYHDDEEYLLPIIRVGADLDAKTTYDFTPLIFAICKFRIRATTCFLDHGADINLRGQDGQSPVQYAVEYNSHACLRLLLDRGADCIVLCQGPSPTVIHAAVEHGDLETVRLLLDASIGVFDIDDLEAESGAGLTIEQHVRKRMNEESILGFGDAVLALVKKVAAPDPVDGTITTAPVSGSAGEDGDEVWEDALEDIGI